MQTSVAAGFSLRTHGSVCWGCAGGYRRTPFKTTRSVMTSSIVSPKASARTNAALCKAGQPSALLEELVLSSLIPAEDWEESSPSMRDLAARCGQADQLLSLLIEHGLLTDYQAKMVSDGH